MLPNHGSYELHIRVKIQFIPLNSINEFDELVNWIVTKNLKFAYKELDYGFILSICSNSIKSIKII